MSLFHLGSKLTWEQYLRVSSFVKDLKGQIRQTNKAAPVPVPEQTRALVASPQALERKYGQSYDALTHTLDSDLGRLDQAFQANGEALHALRHSFDYHMALVVEQLRLQSQTMLNLEKRLDAIHATLENPVLTQAKEYYRIGCERLVKGLLDKALEAFLESEKKDDTNFMTQLLIGKLYLYGINDECNLINLAAAERHLRAAARYAKAEMKLLPEASQFAGEALLHAAISCYAQADHQGKKGNKIEAGRLIQESLSLSKQATKIYPQLSESHYHTAKMAALIGDGKTAAAVLEKAITLNEEYCLKADVDPEFRYTRKEITDLFLQLRQKSGDELSYKFQKVERLLTEWSFVTEEARNAEADMRRILAEARACMARKTYFDNRDAMQLLQQIEVIFQSLLVHKLALHKMSAHYGRVNVIAISPHGTYLASGGTDRTVRIWRLSDNQLLFTLQGHREAISELTFSHSGAVLASVDRKGTVRLWQVAKGQMLREIGEPGAAVQCLAFSPDDSMLAIGSSNRDATLWRVADGRLVQRVSGHKSSVDTVVFSYDGSMLATGSPDNTAMLWDVKEGKLRHRFLGCSGLANSLAFSVNDKILITGANDGSVRFYQVDDGSLLYALPAKNGNISWLALSSSGSTLATVNYGQSLQLWDATDGKLLYNLTPFSPGITAVRFSPDETIVAATDFQDRSIKLWNVHDGKLAHVIAGDLTTSAFSPDGTILVTGDETGSLRFWGRMITAKPAGMSVAAAQEHVPEFDISDLGAEQNQVPRSPARPKGNGAAAKPVTARPAAGDWLERPAAPRPGTNVRGYDKPPALPERIADPAPPNIESVYQAKEPPAEEQPSPFEVDPAAAPRRSSRVIDHILQQIAGEMMGDAPANPAEGGSRDQSSPFDLSGASDRPFDFSELERQRQERREKSGRCLVCGRHLGASAKLLKMKYCRKHYFNH